MNRVGLLLALAAMGCAQEGTPGVGWITVANPSDHAKFFPVASGSHALACGACHGAGNSFREFDCVSCHAGTLQQDLDRIHAGVSGSPGYQPVSTPLPPGHSRTCLGCHPTGLVDPARAAQDHGDSFPISAETSHAYGKTVTVRGTQIVNGCATCHVDVANRSNVDCTGCHVESGNGASSATVPADQTTAHSGRVSDVGANGAPDNLWLGTGPVGTGSGASARCIQCHGGDARPKGSVAVHGQAGSGHIVFEIGSAKTGHFFSCDQCHTARLMPPNRKNPELDFSQASCDRCHEATGTAGVLTTHAAFGTPLPSPYPGGDPNNSRACLGCHPSGGSASGGFDHAWFPIAAADVHTRSVAKCADCHADPASYQGDPAGNLSGINCTGCHQDAVAVHTTPKVSRNIWDVPGGTSFAGNAGCLGCHAGNIGGSVASWSTPLVFRLAQHDAHCRSGPAIAGGERTHSLDRNAENGVNMCFACHDAALNTGSSPWARDWAAATGCPACHEHAGGAPRASCR